MVDKYYQMYRYLYENERENHNKLRVFYEMREQEWMKIIEQHRKNIEEYQQHKSQRR